MGGNCTKRLDLTGQRFGKLTVVSRAENIGRDTAWLCRCDCGGEKAVRTANLRKGRTRSCGCGLTGPMLPGTKQLDLTGQRFGKLVAVAPVAEPDRRGTYKWLCRCDCGGETAVAVSNLRNGHTRSCGCESRLSLESLHYVDGTNIELIRKNTRRSNNTSGCAGVVWRKKDRRWSADIGFQGKRYYLGLYERYEDAVRARKEAETRYFGAFLADYDARAEQEAVSASQEART